MTAYALRSTYRDISGFLLPKVSTVSVKSTVPLFKKSNFAKHTVILAPVLYCTVLYWEGIFSFTSKANGHTCTYRMYVLEWCSNPMACVTGKLIFGLTTAMHVCGRACLASGGGKWKRDVWSRGKA